MNSIVLTLLILFFGLQGAYASNKAAEPLSVAPVEIQGPYFWENSEKAKRKIFKQREILVSVKEEKSSDVKQPKILKMLGVGVINLSARKAQTEAEKFEQLTEVSSYIKKVVRLRPPQRIFFHSKAFGYHAQMWMLTQSIAPVDAIKVEDKKPGEIRFVVERGTFTGLVGSIRFLERARNRTEVQFLATYKYKELPIPRLFVEYGLEVVIQKISARLRRHLERKNKNFI